MALFTDGPIASIEDLHGYDTQLIDVATSEGIDVTRKLAQAHDEISIELSELLHGVSISVCIANVVVTPPLRQWHIFRSLEMVYRDAFNSQLNDRYAGKRDEYRELVRWAHERVLQSGLGIATNPISQAPPPVLQPTAGALASGMYYVAISWANAGNEEGAVSEPVTIAIAGSSFLVQHGAAPANATGWHVYVGTDPTTLLRQNTSVVELGETWSQPDVIANGKRSGSGQVPAFVLGLPRMILRG
jgi:hypothetical protein